MRAILDSEPSSIVIRRLSNLITRQLEDCINQTVAIQTRAVFFSLPTEILSSVLEFAIRLSSICSHLRRIAI
ncbi:hypothetical protein SCHPADRAFT_332600 [Schizopora paradoxa]|uniref:Uncharacterized protein n=1 Tax=Schizopora paradoxa TaxID=27342 RepID=A0A0H2RQ37_9AGAM|nr:hypothetical protein SCHPADRAFT_332600 [Schizopora paradoxa]